MGDTFSEISIYNSVLDAYPFLSNDAIKSNPPDFIADACIPRRYVEAMRKLGWKVLYINEINGHMSDTEVMNIGYYLGVPIATQNIKHFEAYLDLIPLRSRRNIHKLVRDTLSYLPKDT